MILRLLLLLLGTAPLLAQQNTSLVGHLPYPDVRLNDIWGYAAPDGTEYALVGTRGGTSIVDLSDPAAPEELFYIEGETSTWRDLKTWEQTAYVTTDGNVREGVLVVDLSQLPDAAPFYNWTPEVTVNGEIDTIFSFHNLYIDERGLLFLSGGNVNDGGVVVADVTGSEPEVIGFGPPVYVHDVYVRDGILYNSEIIEGQFSVYDTTDPQQFELLGASPTPFRFTHNAWLNDAGNVLFTTDERPGAPVAAYELSDPSDIRYLDEIRADTFYGEVLIPHNVHVLDDYVVTSNYLAGLTVFDAAEPDNLVQVAQYLTPTPDIDLPGGFHGAWGAYPFLPSGLVLVSDIEEGLFVIDVDYQRAARFAGTVRSAVTQLPLDGVEINYPRETLVSDLSGQFSGGFATPQSVTLTLTKPGFEPLTVTVELTAGTTQQVDVVLTPLPEIPIGGTVTDEHTGAPLADAQLSLFAPGLFYETTTDAQGNYTFDAVFINEYVLAVGKWGHLPHTDSILVLPDARFDYRLTPGYADDFNQDFGWDVRSTTPDGVWERGNPVPTTLFGAPANPAGDNDADGITSAYVTGLAGGSPTSADLDDGETQLTSPVMDLRAYAQADIAFSYWWLNENSRDGADSLYVYLENGAQSRLLQTVSRTTSRAWRDTVHTVPVDFALNEQVQIRVVATDLNNGNTIEAGFDRFRVVPRLLAGRGVLENTEVLVNAFPNPSRGAVTVRYRFSEPGNYTYRLVDVLGRTLEEGIIESTNGEFMLRELPAGGTYFLTFYATSEVLGVVPLVRG